MKPRRHFRLLLAIGLIAGLLPMTIGTVIEAVSARSIEGQDGWSGGTVPISASVDQIVDQSGLNQRTGTGAWRISNNTSLGNYNGNFAGWVFGPGLPVSAGQPSSGAVADQFTATLWFRSASAAADGSNMEIDLGTVPGDDRNDFLAVTNRADADGGLQLRAGEPDGATGNFRPTQIIATGIARGVYHRLDIITKFLDGDANDTVEYALDGVPLANPLGGTTFGTFEGWRNGLQFTYALSNRLYFRSGAPPSAYGAFTDTAAQGFFFDDLFYAVANQATPALRLAAYATGFEPGFSAGSIESQESWSGGTIPIVATVDQAVDLAGLNQRTGTGAWRISNNTSLGNHNGAFAGWVFGPGLPVAAGHPSSGAGANQFGATLWFRSASAVADGSNMEIDLGTVPGDDRNNFLAVTNRADADGGLQLRAGEPDGVTGNFRPTQIIATGITRGVYHRLDIVAKFFDGQGNDTIEYALDGVPLANPLGGTTFGTFEGWRDGLQFPYALSNRLYFRSGAPPSAYGAFTDTAAQGFYFDDLFYAVANQAAPATSLAAYATGFEPPAIPAPDLTITKTHVGNFTQGQIGAQFTVTVTNSGTPSTIGVVTLIDTVPTGLTPMTASGTGWSCTVAGATVTCTRSDALAPGASYPPATITVDVAASAPASVANTATVSGGGDVNTANNTATDVTTILPGTVGPGVVTDVASFFAFDPAFPGGVSVAAADVTGDGVADIIMGAGAGGGPHLRAFSLVGGAQTEVASFFAYDPAFAGGISVAAGDVTGDGVAEILTGAGPGGGPHVRAFSLAGGVVTEVASFFAFDPAFPGGVSVAAGDVTGDGIADIITGMGPGGGPQVRVFSMSGGTPTEVANFFAYDPAFPGGVSVATGDVTGDGIAEIIIGAGPSGGPHVRAFSLAGGTPTEVASFFAYDPAFPGGATVAAADLTGDGVAEIVTGAGPSGGPHVRAFSVAGGVTEVASFFAYDLAFPGGVHVAAADLTGDGVAEITTGAGPGGGPHVRVLDVSGVTVNWGPSDVVSDSRNRPADRGYRSVRLWSQQSRDGVDPHGSPRRYQRGDENRTENHRQRAQEGRRIGGADAVEDAAQ